MALLSSLFLSLCLKCLSWLSQLKRDSGWHPNSPRSQTTRLLSLRLAPDFANRSLFCASASSFSVVGLRAVRRDRALLAAALLKPKGRKRGGCWTVEWLYIYSAEHMGLSGAASRYNNTTFWKCMIAEVWFAAESSLQLWRRRWRFERCQRRVSRTR